MNKNELKQIIKECISEVLEEKWSRKYKKSIDCNHPKGFSQKAHCHARKLRKSGVKTKSKSINESWLEKKLWFTPNGRTVDAGGSHEDWIKNNDKSVPVGFTLIDTYNNAVDRGYVRGIYDGDMLTLSNLPSYDFSMAKLNRKTKETIEDFVIEKNIRIVASGRGNLLKSFQFDRELAQ